MAVGVAAQRDLGGAEFVPRQVAIRQGAVLAHGPFLFPQIFGLDFSQPDRRADDYFAETNFQIRPLPVVRLLEPLVST